MKQKKNQFVGRRLMGIVEKFSSVPILVVGDAMLDLSLRGPVSRLSPEAPVPIVDVRERDQTPGGAGNVAHNLVSLGARAMMISVRGDDASGAELEKELSSLGIDVKGLLLDRSRPTITKTRILAGHQQVVRLDVERKDILSGSLTSRIFSQLKKFIPLSRGIIISDYGKGVVSTDLIRFISRWAKKFKLTVVVDPKMEHFLYYKGVDCVTPNSREAIEGMRAYPPKNQAEFMTLGLKILRKLKSKSLLITRGEEGMTLFEGSGRVTSIPAYAKEVFDVTGAGDTVVASFALARAVGASAFEAAQLANVAASLVVAKQGTAVTHQKDLMAALQQI